MKEKVIRGIGMKSKVFFSASTYLMLLSLLILLICPIPKSNGTDPSALVEAWSLAGIIAFVLGAILLVIAGICSFIKRKPSE